MNLALKSHRTFNIIEQSQKDVCRALGSVGILEKSLAIKSFGDKNLKELLEKDMIKTFNSYDNGKINKIYHLTEKGKKYTRKHLVYGSLYKWNKLQVKHDRKLSEIYLSLSRAEKKSWRNESQIRKYSNNKVRGIDGSYTAEDGRAIAVEVVTTSYSTKTLQEKVEVMKEHFQGVNIKYA